VGDILVHFFWLPLFFFLWQPSAVPSVINYRVYDSYYGDYHDWDDHERVTSTGLGKHVKETWREFQGDWLSPRESVGIHLL